MSACTRSSFCKFTVVIISLFVALGCVNPCNGINDAKLDLRESDGYKIIPENYTYSDATKFSPGFMAGLYKVTRKFLDSVVEEFDPYDFMEVDDSTIKIKDKDISHILEKYSSILVVTTIILIIALILPLFGIFFAICRCCGNCGSKPTPCAKKSDHCHKIVFGILLVSFILLMLFAVVTSYGSSEHLNEGVNGLPDNIKSDLTVINEYVNNTIDEVVILLSHNVDVLVTKLNTYMEVDPVIEEIFGRIDITVLDPATTALDGINEKISSTTSKTDELKTSIASFKSDMEKLNKKIENKDCSGQNECEDIKEQFANIYQKDLPELPDIGDATKDLPTSEKLKTDIDATKNKARDTVKGTVDDTVTKANVEIEKVQKEISNHKTDVDKSVKDITKTITDSTDPFLDTVKEYLDDYSNYVYALLVVFSCILLAIAALLILGFLWGTFFRSSEQKNSKCCSKAVGSKFLISSVSLICIFGFFFGLITVTLFLLGILGQKVICIPLQENPETSKVVDILNTLIKNQDIDFSLSTILSDCSENVGLYNAFRLNKTFNVDDIDIDEIKTALESLDVNINFDDGFNDIFKNVENIQITLPTEDITSLIAELTSIEGKISDLKNKVEQVGSAMEDIAEDLQTMIDSITPIQIELNELSVMVKGIEPVFIDFKATIQGVKSDLQDNLQETNVFLQDKVETLKDDVIGEAQTFLNITKSETVNNLGRCKPLKAAFDGLLAASCDKVLLPMSGYAFSMFWAMTLFIPIIIVSIVLANLYQKYQVNDKSNNYENQNYNPDDIQNQYYGNPQGNVYQNQNENFYSRNPYSRSNKGPYDDTSAITRF